MSEICLKEHIIKTQDKRHHDIPSCNDVYFPKHKYRIENNQTSLFKNNLVTLSYT